MIVNNWKLRFIKLTCIINFFWILSRLKIHLWILIKMIIVWIQKPLHSWWNLIVLRVNLLDTFRVRNWLDIYLLTLERLILCLHKWWLYLIILFLNFIFLGRRVDMWRAIFFHFFARHGVWVKIRFWLFMLLFLLFYLKLGPIRYFWNKDMQVIDARWLWYWYIMGRF